MPDKDLSSPLLATNAVTLKIQAHEWDAIESESSNEATNEPPDVRNRHERYARMAEEASIPVGNVSAKWGTEPPGPAGWPLRPGALRCWASCFAFMETSMNIVALFLLIRRRNWLSVLFLAPTHILVMTMESYLAYNDRAITEKRLEHRSTGPVWQVLLFDVSVVLVLGCLHGYTLLRARQCWKDKPGANSVLREAGMHGFLYEVEAHGAAAGNFDAPASRLDSHYMFLSGIPRVVVLTNRLISQYYSTLEVLVFAATAFLSLLNVVHAVVHFDFWASRHIRRQYKLSHSFRFQVAHCIYRFSEVGCRLLVLVAAGAVARKAPRVMIAGVLIDAALGVLALRMVSTMSPKVMILSIPLLVLDVSRYIDEHGFAWPAMRLSRLIGVLRNTEFMAALFVYWTYADEPEDLGPLEGSGALVLGLLMLLARSTCFVLGLTRVGQAGMDLFTATLRGDAAAVEEFLQQDCDPNTRQGDALQQGALHVSAAHGHLECAIKLLQNGADPDMPDARGDNPLHIACRRADLHMARVLVQPPKCAFYATDSSCARTVARKNKAGKTPAQVIKRGAAVELTYLLRSVSKHGLTKRCSLMEGCRSQDLRQFFGPLVGGEHYDIGTRRRHSDTNGNTTAGLTSFMFSRGVGEQLAAVLDVMAEDSDQLSLSSLKALGTLGAGGFGKVIKVTDVRTGALYAMKLQRKDRTTEVALREAKEMRGSRHAFVAHLVRVFHTRSFYGLLMELCDKDLNRRILEEPTMPTGSTTASGSTSLPAGKGTGIATAHAARYTACVLLALEYLHSKEVVFRDLKPENVLVTLPEKGDYAKLTDFGLACKVDAIEKCSPSRRTSSASGSDWFSASEHVSSEEEPARQSPRVVAFSGTPAFMPSDAYEASCAPEESREAKVARLAARDWYALGCCLILMILGEGGGKKVSTDKRVVLLPLPEGELHICLHKAASDPDVDQRALSLACALTAPLNLRAGAEVARRSPFLREALDELVPVAAHYGQCEEEDSSPKRLSGRSR